MSAHSNRYGVDLSQSHVRTWGLNTFSEVMGRPKNLDILGLSCYSALQAYFWCQGGDVRYPLSHRIINASFHTGVVQ